MIRLVLKCRPNDAVMIGDDVRVTIVDVVDGNVRVGIDCPGETSVHRQEMYDAIRRQSAAAASGPRVAPAPLASGTQVPPPPVSIRPATAADLGVINWIYNHFVLTSTCTYQEEPSTIEERTAWFEAHGPNHPVTVAERDGEVVGWGSLSKFHPRSAYGRTVENSVYVRHDSHRQGVGAALLADLLERAKAAGHHTILALIDTEQRGSIRLHEKLGFVEVARLREVGFKFGRWLDVVYLQRMV